MHAGVNGPKHVTADLTYSKAYLHPAREQRIISLLLRLPPLTPASSECRSNQSTAPRVSISPACILHLHQIPA